MLNKNINTRYWESHGFVSEDGQLLVFASDRPGGFGGLDHYISAKTGYYSIYKEPEGFGKEDII